MGIVATCASAPAQIATYAAIDVPGTDVTEQLDKASVRLRVTSDARGHITTITLLQSSGYATLDAASIRSVRQLIVSPQTVDCHPVATTYDARIDFRVDTDRATSGRRLSGHVTLTGAACTPDHPVLLAQMAQIPVIRVEHGALPPSADATVEVSVDPQGQVISAKITQSSGSSSYDTAALTAARASEYTPAQSNCAPVAGTYILRIQGQRTNP